MQERIGGLALSLVAWAVAVTPCAARGLDPNPSPWTAYQGNALHSGYVPVTLAASEFARVWSIPVSPGYALNPATEADGMVYVTSHAGLFVLSAKDGSTLWSTVYPGVLSVNPPAYDDGNVYLQTANGDPDTYIWGYEAATGTPLFQTPAGSQGEHYYAPTIVDHTLYMDGGTFGGMYSVDGKTGRRTGSRS